MPPGGGGMSSGVPSGTAPTHYGRQAKDGGLGPPDVYPQDPHQKEDELSAVHVKQGFTQSYSSMVSNVDEYASAQNKTANMVGSKVLQQLSSIQSKKEDMNTLGEGPPSSSSSSASAAAKRRQTLNTKDHFWLVTGRNKAAVDNWFKSLSSGSRPLSWLAKKVPIFNKREEVLTTLSEHGVTAARAVWFVKMTAAYSLAMAETNKTKKRQVSDPSSEWTGVLIRFLKEQLSEVDALIRSSSSSGPSPGGGGGSGLGIFDSDPNQPEKSAYFKHWTYVAELAQVMYHQGLLDRQEWLQWIVETVEKYKYPDDPIQRLILPLVLQYLPEFVRTELLSRKLSLQCAKKITYLVNDTDAICNGGGGGDATMQPHPLIQAFVELMEDPATRFIILGLSSVIQSVTMECPTALVWNYFGENKTPSSLLASPLDYLPNCSPSGLPMPPRECNQALRHQIKQAETLVKERSIAAEAKWAGEYSPPARGVRSTRNVNLVLSILEELDGYVFERTDASNCIESLYGRLFAASSASAEPANDDILIHTLCEWAVTSKRSGEHRAFVVAKLLEMRQVQLSPNGKPKRTSISGYELYLAGLKSPS